ncbi:MAG: hypothetical protein ABJB98_06830 [Actinomycetota bacterium]
MEEPNETIVIEQPDIHHLEEVKAAVGAGPPGPLSQGEDNVREAALTLDAIPTRILVHEEQRGEDGVRLATVQRVSFVP